MSESKSLVFFVLSLAMIGCGRHPGQRVDVKTSPLPEVASGDKGYSDYQPSKPYTSNEQGVFARDVFGADSPSGTRIEARDWELPPAKETTEIHLPAAALIEVRSGAGTLNVSGKSQPLPAGSIVPVSQGQSFTLANAGSNTLIMRVYLISAS
jgi:hypothetical protein